MEASCKDRLIIILASLFLTIINGLIAQKAYCNISKSQIGVTHKPSLYYLVVFLGISNVQSCLILCFYHFIFSGRCWAVQDMFRRQLFVVTMYELKANTDCELCASITHYRNKWQGVSLAWYVECHGAKSCACADRIFQDEKMKSKENLLGLK